MAVLPLPGGPYRKIDRPLTTALQALFLLNDPFAHRQADRLAARLEAEAADDAARVDRAYRLAFGRPATGDEVSVAREYLAACRAKLGDAGVPAERQAHAAWASYARVLLSSNEFLFVD